MLDALLDAGADIDAPGAVVAGGTPLEDARVFGNWRAARRLVERGARTTLHDEAALGLTDRLATRFDGPAPPAGEELHAALWNACHGGQRGATRIGSRPGSRSPASAPPSAAGSPTWPPGCGPGVP